MNWRSAIKSKARSARSVVGNRRQGVAKARATFEAKWSSFQSASQSASPNASQSTGATALKAHVREAFASLNVNRQRTALALIGLALGVAAVTAMVSVGVTAKAEVAKRFKNLGTETLVIRNRSSRSARRRAGATIRVEDAEALPEQTSTIAMAAPTMRLHGDLTYRGRSLGSKSIVGVSEALADISKLSLSSGRFISDLDVHRKYCVVGFSIAQSMMRAAGRKELVGDSVKLAGKLYTIAGVLADTPDSNLRPFRANESILVPITTAQRAFKTEIQYIIAHMTAGANPDDAVAEVQEHFRRLARGLRVRVQTAEQLIAELREQMRLFTLLLAAVGGISLVVGGAGTMNVMLASVAERRKEIGVRRALGACRRDIRNQFLIEALTLALIGGLLGIALGVVVPYAICLYAGWSFLASPVAMLAGFGVASGVGVFFGAYPARRAARQDPIAALRAP